MPGYNFKFKLVSTGVSAGGATGSHGGAAAGPGKARIAPAVQALFKLEPEELDSDNNYSGR